jgi:putative FmdB family regulatory protein
MPTYEYVCQKCGHEFEQFQSIKDDPLTKCPACKRGKVVRKIGTGAGLLFKGSGFYITDYRSESYKSGAKSDSAAGGSGGGGSAPAATPAPAKPAAKSSSSSSTPS